tara:strand:- start:478 stop:783 length:306 start_codon:yes stop_codon:yes gene_type:complete
MKTRFYYTPQEIAKNLYLMYSYKDLLKAAIAGKPCKDVKNVGEDLQAMFCSFTKEELIDFDSQVKSQLKDVERKVQIKRLRNEISNKKIRLQELLNDIKKG